jgi:hypothetical protein
MKLESYEKDGDPGYPTFTEGSINRRNCLKSFVKIAGMIIAGGAGIVSCKNKNDNGTRLATADTGDSDIRTVSRHSGATKGKRCRIR